MHHSICTAHTARSRCFVPAFHQSPRRHKELSGWDFGEFNVATVSACGRVALRRLLPQQTWRFPRIDRRSIEASSAPTRRGAACARRCRLKAGARIVSARILSASGRGGNFKEKLGDRSRRRLTELSAQVASEGAPSRVSVQ